MGRLDGKVAIISGAARGQGAEEAKLFAAEGAAVIVTDVLAEQGAAVAAGVNGLFIEHDVRSESAWNDVVSLAMDKHGRIDVLVNNAGIYRRGDLASTSLEEYREIIEINQIGVFLGMKSVAPIMTEQQSGSIVNISSIAGMLGTPRSIAYGASKWAVRGMTKAAGIELARYGVRVNSIHPGMIDTEMMTEVTGGDNERFSRIEATVPMRRVAAPEEVARLALFLASDESSYCTASEFVVDAGVSAV